MTVRADFRAGGVSLLAGMALLLLSGTGCVRQASANDPQLGASPFLPPPESSPAVSASPDTTAVPSATPAADDNLPTATAAARYLNDPSLPRVRYDISAEFDYEAHTVTVFQSVLFVNRQSAALDDLILIVQPNRSEGAFLLRELTWAEGGEISNFTLDGSLLHIPLPAPLPPWTSVGLNIGYRLRLPMSAGPFGYTARQTNLGDWYPFVPLYDPDRGWLAHPPGAAGVGEFLTYEIGDYDVEFRLVDPPDGLVLAASAPGQQEGEWTRYHVEAARNFTLSASTEFEIVEDRSGPVIVQAYAFPEHRAAAEESVAVTIRALRLFTEIYGPLERVSISIVESEFPDGMEYDGLYFLGESYFSTYFGGPQNFLTTLSVHEAAHQWWYGLVANDQAYEPWLDEALATYSERLYFEEYHPELQDWWWEFRVTLYAPDGWVNTDIYAYEAFRPYVNAVYLRGTEFLEDLRQQMGDEAFFAMLRDYQARQRFGQAAGADFLAFMAERSPRDVGPIVGAYFVEAPDLPP